MVVLVDLNQKNQRIGMLVWVDLNQKNQWIGMVVWFDLNQKTKGFEYFCPPSKKQVSLNIKMFTFLFLKGP